MKIGLVINDVETEKANYTTTHIALHAIARGHEVHYIEAGGFVLDANEGLHAHSRQPSRANYVSVGALLGELQSANAKMDRINLEKLDVLFLRNNPSDDIVKRPWARLAPLYFGRLAASKGVIVLNDPDGLTHAINKVYLELFPQSVRPLSIVTRDKEDIRDFARSLGGPIIVKPLAGSGGHNVFFVQSDTDPNFNQIVDAVVGEGYALAQTYLEAAKAGDTRLFLLNGDVLMKNGKVAAVHRVGAGSDIRSNMTSGGHGIEPQITDEMLALAAAVNPMLVQDGLFFVGLDIVGDKLMEINVFSPGGLSIAGQLAGENFFSTMIDALEKKVAARNNDPCRFTNRELACLV
jgi:glutathione synthase